MSVNAFIVFRHKRVTKKKFCYKVFVEELIYEILCKYTGFSLVEKRWNNFCNIIKKIGMKKQVQKKNFLTSSPVHGSQNRDASTSF